VLIFGVVLPVAGNRWIISSTSVYTILPNWWVWDSIPGRHFSVIESRPASGTAYYRGSSGGSKTAGA